MVALLLLGVLFSWTGPRDVTALFAQTYSQLNRIAYTGTNRNIYLIRPDGTKARSISPDPPPDYHRRDTAEVQGLGFGWPTWSPSGRRLAYCSLLQSDTGTYQVAVHWTSVRSGDSRTVFRTTAGYPYTVANKPLIPAYMLWAPHGKRLALLVSIRGELKLFVATRRRGGSLRRIVGGQPLYFTWSPGADRLLVHLHMYHLLVDVGPPLRINPFKATSLSSFTPGWSPDGRRTLFMDDREDGNVLLVDSPRGDTAAREIPAPGMRAYLWSPDGRSVGLSGDFDLRRSHYRGFSILNTRTWKKKPITDKPVRAFFWSPDGSRIAYVTGKRGSPSVDWWVYDRSEGEHRHLMSMVPSSDQRGVITYFHQYAHSHSPWAPDSRRLVVAGSRPGESTSDPSDTASSLWILDAGEPDHPRKLTEGTLGVWAPKGGLPIHETI